MKTGHISIYYCPLFVCGWCVRKCFLVIKQNIKLMVFLLKFTAHLSHFAKNYAFKTTRSMLINIIRQFISLSLLQTHFGLQYIIRSQSAPHNNKKVSCGRCSINIWQLRRAARSSARYSGLFIIQYGWALYRPHVSCRYLWTRLWSCIVFRKGVFGLYLYRNVLKLLKNEIN